MEKPLEEFREDADEAAGRASEISRNLGLGAIATIWIFKNPESAHTNVYLPSSLLTAALLCAVISLMLDLLHYVFRFASLDHFYRRKEKVYDAMLSEDAVAAAKYASDVHTPDYITAVSWGFWITKLFLIALAYVLISCFLIGKLS